MTNCLVKASISALVKSRIKIKHLKYVLSTRTLTQLLALFGFSFQKKAKPRLNIKRYNWMLIFSSELVRRNSRKLVPYLTTPDYFILVVRQVIVYSGL